MPVAPVYAASKAGVVHFVRSAAPGLAKRGTVKLHAVCPEFVDTPLVRGGCCIGNKFKFTRSGVRLQAPCVGRGFGCWLAGFHQRGCVVDQTVLGLS